MHKAEIGPEQSFSLSSYSEVTFDQISLDSQFYSHVFIQRQMATLNDCVAFLINGAPVPQLPDDSLNAWQKWASVPQHIHWSQWHTWGRIHLHIACTSSDIYYWHLRIPFTHVDHRVWLEIYSLARRSGKLALHKKEGALIRAAWGRLPWPLCNAVQMKVFVWTLLSEDFQFAGRDWAFVSSARLDVIIKRIQLKREILKENHTQKGKVCFKLISWCLEALRRATFSRGKSDMLHVQDCDYDLPHAWTADYPQCSFQAKEQRYDHCPIDKLRWGAESLLLVDIWEASQSWNIDTVSYAQDSRCCWSFSLINLTIFVAKCGTLSINRMQILCKTTNKPCRRDKRHAWDR